MSSFAHVDRPSRTRYAHPFLGLCLVLALCTPIRAQVFDGVTVGIGLGIYQGELDRNPVNNPIEFLSLGEMNLLVAGDRQLGFLANEVALNYQRINIEVPEAEMGVNMLSLDLTTGTRFDLLGRRGFIRIFAGVGGSMVLTSYERICSTSDRSGCSATNSQTIEGANRIFDPKESRMVFSFPVGLVIQDAVRIGVRVVASDYLDSTERTGTGPDVVSFITLGYRFLL